MYNYGENITLERKSDLLLNCVIEMAIVNYFITNEVLIRCDR